MKVCNPKHAFSLIELSIVVTIIALLLAGISAGNKVLRSSSLQASLQQIISYRSAYVDFMINYRARPGDIEIAYELFDDGTDTVCGAESECDGDGDGILELSTKSDSEIYRAWQHLSLANIIDEQYAGEWNESNSVPIARFNNANISFDYDADIEENIIKMGAQVTATGMHSDGAILFPLEAYKLDLKMDDGIATSGQILGYENLSSDGTAGSNCLNGDDYLTSFDDEESCVVGFVLEN